MITVFIRRTIELFSMDLSLLLIRPVNLRVFVFDIRLSHFILEVVLFLIDSYILICFIETSFVFKENLHRKDFEGIFLENLLKNLYFTRFYRKIE